jgi:hypothetical protein
VTRCRSRRDRRSSPAPIRIRRTTRRPSGRSGSRGRSAHMRNGRAPADRRDPARPGRAGGSGPPRGRTSARRSRTGRPRRDGMAPPEASAPHASYVANELTTAPSPPVTTRTLPRWSAW